jgi:hypothetical protein
MTYIFKEPVRMLVIHPKYGKLEVRAYCILDAKLQAANIWDITLDDLQRAQIGIEKAALENK